MTESLESYKKKIIGLPISYAWRGHGSAIFIEFGGLTEYPKRNHPVGEYSVMLDCDWRIENIREILCGSFCSQDDIESTISSLLNDTISNVELAGTLPEIVITLVSGKKILSFTSDVGQPEWGFFLPDRSWLCSKEGRLVREKA